jgi:hypothetical protein
VQMSASDGGDNNGRVSKDKQFPARRLLQTRL